jgi:hypothetical protein
MSQKFFIYKIFILLILSIFAEQNLCQNKANPSYVKIFKGEKEILQEMNADFIGMSLESKVNNIIFKDEMNIKDTNFPNIELDLLNISLEGSQFSLGDNSQINFSEDFSLIVQDTGNISSYTFLKANYSYRDLVSKTNETEQFSVTVFADDTLYNKNYTLSASDNKSFKLEGKVTFLWALPVFKFNEKTSQKAQNFITTKFNDLFYRVLSMQIEKELDDGLNKYYSKTNYSTKVKFSLSEYLSSLKTINHTLSFDVNKIKLSYSQNDSKILQTREYSGFYSSYDAVVNKTPEANFDIFNNNTGIDIKNLRNAMFIDKFLFEYLLDTDEFQNFFIRREAKQSDFPQALEIDLNVREISKIIPEVSRLYSLTKKIYVNFAIFNPSIIFNDNLLPQIKSNFDFTFYVRDFEGNFKQIFTCQTDLLFDVAVKFSSEKNFVLNFGFDLNKVINFKMSNNFSYIEVDHLKYLIEEIVSFGVEKNGGMLFEKDLDLSKVFEDKFMVKYFNSGILFYEYMN